MLPSTLKECFASTCTSGSTTFIKWKKSCHFICKNELKLLWKKVTFISTVVGGEDFEMETEAQCRSQLPWTSALASTNFVWSFLPPFLFLLSFIHFCLHPWVWKPCWNNERLALCQSWKPFVLKGEPFLFSYVSLLSLVQTKIDCCSTLYLKQILHKSKNVSQLLRDTTS